MYATENGGNGSVKDMDNLFKIFHFKGNIYLALSLFVVFQGQAAQISCIVMEHKTNNELLVLFSLNY